MKYIIAGRSGSGKSELAKRLEDKGLRIMKTYTTRSPRNKEDAEKYHFIKPDEISKYPNRILETEFFGNTYFTTPEAVAESDVLILEPEGTREIIEKFPDIQFCLVYISAEKPEIADARAIARADDKQAEQAAIEKRRAGEDDRFGPLEAELESDTWGYVNCSTKPVANDFQPETLDKLAANMTGKLRKNNNFVKIMTQMVALGALRTDDNNKIAVEFTDGERPVSLDVYAEIYVDMDDTFSYIIRSWLTHEIDFKIPGELAPDALFRQEIKPE